MKSLTINELQYELTHNRLIIIDLKIIGLTGLILGLIALAVGMYCQIEIVPNYIILNTQHELSKIDKTRWGAYAEQKFLLENIALVLSSLAAILGLVSGVKKQKIGWIALGIGLTSFALVVIQLLFT